MDDDFPSSFHIDLPPFTFTGNPGIQTAECCAFAFESLVRREVEKHQEGQEEDPVETTMNLEDNSKPVNIYT